MRSGLLPCDEENRSSWKKGEQPGESRSSRGKRPPASTSVSSAGGILVALFWELKESSQSPLHFALPHRYSVLLLLLLHPTTPMVPPRPSNPAVVMSPVWQMCYGGYATTPAYLLLFFSSGAPGHHQPFALSGSSVHFARALFLSSPELKMDDGCP